MNVTHRLTPFIRLVLVSLSLTPMSACHGPENPTSSVPSALPVSSQPEERCLSLAELMRCIKEASDSGRPLAEDALHLGCISRFQGYYIDADKKDVVLYGDYEPKHLLHLDDLVILLQAAQREQPVFCSLDPHPSNILRVQNVLKQEVDIANQRAGKELAKRLCDAIGPQQVVVSVDRTSRVSRTMLWGDYKMKQASLSLTSLKGVDSPLYQRLDDSRQAGTATMSRYWFAYIDHSPTFNLADDIVELRSCKTGVLTERQKASELGELQDDENAPEDPSTIKFTVQLTELLQANDPGVPEFTDLIRMFRLEALVQAIQTRAELERAGVDLSPLQTYHRQADSDMPEELPGLANVVANKVVTNHGNVAETAWTAGIAVGGCSMEPRIGLDSYAPGPTSLNDKRRLMMSSRPAGMLWWSVEASLVRSSS